jgi:hypothetical protein
MLCEEKHRLLAAYEQVAQRYSAAVTELHRTLGTMAKAEYDGLYRETEMLHAEVTKAQGEFNSHVTAHRC